jgi:transglutaminase-like putative cysteine protease
VPYPLLDFLELGGPVRPGGRLEAFAAAVPVPGDAPVGEQVLGLGRHIRSHVSYRKHVTSYDSSTEDVLALGAGVCQDFTHLMLGCLRLRGIPCRYVSGYLHVEPMDGESAQSHSWIEFHAPGTGWIPFDPTHNREIDERYVLVAHGRHYDDVPPNKGIYRGNADEELLAVVSTRLSAPKDVSVLHEEVESIDLPVYRELPERRRARPQGPSALLLTHEAAEQQQQ